MNIASRTVLIVALLAPIAATAAVKKARVAVMEIRSLGTDLRLYEKSVGSVELLGCREPLRWSVRGNGLHVKMPEQRPCEHAFVLRIKP